MDFSDPANARSYSGRDADRSWADAVTGLVAPAGAVVVDVGCGGGTYSRAWHDVGAARVIGIDSSTPVLATAREVHGDVPGVEFAVGDAAATGLPDGIADVVFARALVHHIADPGPVVAEARRVLRPGGTYLVQDRTPDDVAQPGSPTNPRGFFFAVFPRLLEVEAGRRPTAKAFATALADGGFTGVTVDRLAEVRRRFGDREQYLAEIAARTGRSILHELDDADLAHLVDELRHRLPTGPLVEQDSWTLWSGRAPQRSR